MTDKDEAEEARGAKDNGEARPKRKRRKRARGEGAPSAPQPRSAPATAPPDAPDAADAADADRGGDNASPKKRKRGDDAPPKSKPRAADAAASATDDEPALLPLGNPLRPLRGGAALVLGSFVAFCLMATNEQYRFGVPIGAIAVFVATFGVLDVAGSFDDPEDRVASRTSLAELTKPLGLLFGGALALFVLICLAVDGRFPANAAVPALAVLVPAAFLATVVGGYRVAETLGVLGAGDLPGGEPRKLYQRHGFWLVVFMSLYYLPLLGSHSLSDPWETHYGEVAREMLARNDWISTWWAQEGWFFSKPHLDFWMQALAMASFGVRYRSDAMLSAVNEGRIPWPEWAVRLPIFLITVLAVYLLYKAVARVWNRRAGLLAGVVLLTMPQWFLLANQTMTDMPYVAPMTAAMALVVLAVNEDPEREVSVYEVAIGPMKLRLSLYHLVLGGIVALALPQILYLASRNLGLDGRGFTFHADAFMSGSPGNCGLPGNEACKPQVPVIHGLHPALQALIWAQAIALVVYLNWGERRTQRLLLLAAWAFLAVTIMGKVLAGAVFIVAGLGLYAVYLLVEGRWPELTRFEYAAGILIVLAIACPWYVAMYVRHGSPFTDRLIFHDMFKRAFVHVHDTNEGDDVSFRFYVWQLGYAMFPWTGLVPAALLYWFKKRESDAKSDAAAVMLFWFVGSFAVVSYMLTKFHHYILPLLPPAAVLTGVLLDGALSNATLPGVRGLPRTLKGQLAYAGAMMVSVAACVAGAARTIEGVGATADKMLLIGGGQALLLLGLAGIGATVWLGRDRVAADEDPVDAESPDRAETKAAFRQRFDRVMLGAVGIAAAALILAVGRDLSANIEGWGNNIRLMHLITYNYKRPWPPSLDFTPTLWAFTGVGVVLAVAMVFARVRQHVVAAFVALGVVFGAWGLDDYFMKISPHWGQRETTIAYYEAAREEPGPLIAYQMNWKGENFYTGNHVPAFVSSGKRFQDYILEEKKKGMKVFYVVTEHFRTNTLSNEITPAHEMDKLTTPELDNKFVLVRIRLTS